MNDKVTRKRTIRSFVRRAGRLTPSQQKALEEYWPRYGIEYSPVALQLQDQFERAAPLVLEIGFGNGETLVQQARENPTRNFVGIEVHDPGVGHCLLRANEDDIRNMRLINHDAIEVLTQQIEALTLARVNLYFPDPWPKKRHHKRRIVQLDFLELVAARLCAKGTLHIATDWAGYAEHIDEVFAESGHFQCLERRVHGGDQPLDRPSTKFERRGLKKGHQIVDWRFVKSTNC